MFEGVFTALVTPFRDGSVDERALTELVELQIHAGVGGLVPCGSTGEAATLSHADGVTHRAGAGVPRRVRPGAGRDARARRLPLRHRGP